MVAASPDDLQLEKGSHICFIGNTLADRMQHDGWLETALIHRFLHQDLVIRNLGFSGDEVDLRLRSLDFGSPDDHLEANRADVVFAFFGYNESYAGEQGAEDFAARLTRMTSHLLEQKYNGHSPPQVVLFSPIAFENLGSPDLPDGREQNRRLELYSEVISQVAQEQHVHFVDLYHPTLRLYAENEQPLTINGIHLNELGNQLLAVEIEKALFGDSKLAADIAAVEPLRQAILEKNFFWFNRYRTVDGYSIFGGRADLKFTNNQTNREVMQREMLVLDELTANRDAKIWAVAKGEPFTVDDSNTSPFIPVITNKPGAGPGGVHIATPPEESIAKMTVADGFRVELFASEEDFPELINPVQMAFDTKGRLWVATWPTYPHWKPKTEMNDRLLILEDTDGDGRADKCTTFAEGLRCPTGFEFYGGGVFVAQAPDLVFLKDLDGDDHADVRQRVLHGLDSADTHHTCNSFVLDPGGALYFQEGTFHHTQVETPWGPSVRSANAAVYRFEPRTARFEVYAPYPFANPHGHVFDRWGRDIVHDGTSSVPYDGSLISGHLEFPEKHTTPPTVYQQRTRPCPGTEILSSRHFPPEMQGNLLVGNVIGFQGVLQYKIEEDGASLHGTETTPLFSSSDESFRPVDFEIGPDGALYFTDWYNPIIGHMQHNLRDPSRDKVHGRVYRFVCKDRPLLKPVKIFGRPVAELLELLKQPENRVRYRAKIELSSHSADEVIPAANAWIRALDASQPDFEHNRLEGLWVHQYMNVVDRDLLSQVLESKDPRGRAAAVRVLCAWRDRVSDTLDLLRQLARDPAPRVRLEAVRAASWMNSADAVDIPLIAAGQETDRYLDYEIQEALRGLKPLWRRAIVAGEPLALSDPNTKARLLAMLDTVDLIKMPGERASYAELLFRSGIPDTQRRRALEGLSHWDNKSMTDVLLDAIHRVDNDATFNDDAVITDLVRFLAEQPSDQLSSARGAIEKLCLAAKRPLVRQVSFVGLIAVDQSIEPAWQLARKSVQGLQDLMNAMPLIIDPNQQAQMYPYALSLLDGLPENLPSAASNAKQTFGRYVRIELPGTRRTLTLAEVEVMSSGVNVARAGKATQRNTAFGGVAERGIDGNKSGVFGDGGETHSQDPTDDPWWEVDLGRLFPIDSVTIYNRTEGEFFKRLQGFNIQILDASRNVVAQLTNLDAPPVQQTYEFQGLSPAAKIRRLAIAALPSVRGREADTLAALTPLVEAPDDRSVVLPALQRIPVSYWPKDVAQDMIAKMIAYVESIPEQQRSEMDVVQAIQLADSLAALLETDTAKQTRRKLAGLGVRVIRVGTVPHRMIFDQDTIVLQAAKPVEILFENNDLMPHNLVIAQPGSMESIGLKSEATASDPAAAERGYIPNDPRIVVASRLLQPRDMQRFGFVAPAQPGVYPMVCTYPGHWRTMNSAVFVVEDLLAYLDDPQTYLANHPLLAEDELLKNRRPRTAWTYADLEPMIAEMGNGVSFDNGRHMFQVANCIGCHRLDEQGTQFGADLTKLDPKITAAEILRAIVEPSHDINKDYQTYKFLMIDGKTYSGIIVAEDDKTVKIIENPLLKAEPLELAKEDIDERTKSPKSIMPEGLLDRLTQHEVLDLIAFVLARGNRQSELFQKPVLH